jgi:hypothetical protein
MMVIVRDDRIAAPGDNAGPHLLGALRANPSVAPHTICAAIIMISRAAGCRVAGGINCIAGTQPR